MNKENIVAAHFLMKFLPNILQPIYMKMNIGQLLISVWSGKGLSQ